MKAARIIFAAVGILLALFGVFRLLTEIPPASLLLLALWLIGAIIIHDGILAPTVATSGWALRRWVPDRGRRFLQIGLIITGLITIIALPMIYLRGSQPEVKSILLRNYGANLTLIIGIVAVITLALYAVRVARDRSGRATGSQTETETR